jgi:alginate O-acetyltransferase complex protein AlgI
MVFSSIEFLFLFLPAFLLAQALLPGKNLVYVLFSLLFYFVGEGWYSLVVVSSVLVNYAVGRALDAQQSPSRRKLAVCLGVSLNLCSLFFFKYAAFFWSNLAGGRTEPWLTSLHLPLGVSFFSFHAISYLVDIYRRDAKAERSLVNLSLYMLMFPQLIAGPILRFHAVARQLQRRVVTARHIHFGFLLFCVGLGQKVLFADTLAHVADPLFARAESVSTLGAWLATVAYALQLLFDFWGYSNMAIGLGWMTGFELPKNFDYPYVSQSITEFWRRWHMSLSRWFRDYLYVPLGGNRGGPARTYRNLFIVFLLCGLWHGAAWTFIAWGAFHGAWLSIERLGWNRALERLPAPARHLYTMLVVLVGWVLFRAESLGEAGVLLSRMFMLSSAPALPLSELLNRQQGLALVGALLFSVPAVPQWLGRWLWAITQRPLPKSVPASVYVCGGLASVALFGAAAVKILTGAYSPFIYFRF